MRLTKLELIGFKSFAKRTELDFGSGITAVIGPNGSGKSNIADAIRWVLGEQSARNLRGSKMEDVIFSGTQSRNSLGYCEVHLTFDNSDGLLNIDYSEVEVSRRLYRSGDSEYSINHNSCRLRDIQELFRDTGIGKDGYSIIGQGKVDEILSNKSNDRRVALEEAAGIMHYRVRKEEAERKLDNTDKNLVRLNDIINELHDRLEPLEQQSITAREFLKLHEELKDLEVNQFLYQYDKTNEKLKTNEQLLNGIQDQENDLETQSAKIQEDIFDLEQSYRRLEQSINENNASLMELLASVESSKGEYQVLLERRKSILSDITKTKESLEEQTQRKNSISETLQSMTVDAEKSFLIEKLDEEIAAAELAIQVKDSELKNAESALENLKTEIMSSMNRIADTKSDLSRFEAMTGAIDSRKEQLLEDENTAKLSSEILSKELNKCGVELNSIQEKCTSLETALIESKQVLSDLEASYQQVFDQSRTLEQELGQTESREHILREMVASHEGYMNSVRNLLTDSKSDRNLSNKLIGVVAELIQVPKQYEIAINMSLGNSLQNIVTHDSDDAQFAVDYLRQKDYGRATFLPISLLRNKPLSDNELSCLKEEGCIGLASDLVESSDEIRPVVDYLLGHTVLVKDFHSGISLKKKGSGSLQIATLTGDIIATGGAISGGSIKKQEISLIGREREIKELSVILKQKHEEYDNTVSAMNDLKSKILQSNLQVESFQNELKENEILLAKQKDTFSIIQRDIENNTNRIKKIHDELNSLLENVDEITLKRNDSLMIQQKLELESSSTQEDVTKSQLKLNELREKKDEALRILSEQKIHLVELKKEQASVDSERNRFLSEQQTASHLMETLSKQLQDLENQLKEVDYQISTAEIQTKSQENVADEKKKNQSDSTAEKEFVQNKLAESRQKKDKLLEDSREITEKKHRIELMNSRMEMELSAMQDRIWEEYELTYDNALKLKHDYPVGSSNSRIAEIKSLIHEMGDVNVSSIEDFKMVSERYTDLTTQRDDLLKAKEDLNKIITELVTTMQNVFTEQFALIQKNFTEVFTELFGGGNAELRLADKEDILGCDIDIIAQPPGKKLQLLSLLSGGERALTAIALLFAMLKLKPPAFCLLDEIESSLDEANVTRFAQYLKNYKDNTQFILITHRKGSMEVCDSLYGVSMEERGVSKIVSARFDDVEVTA